ncbi:2-C-methyl-D-erythritol 4-phosphate cytidylyltransferase [Moraxella nasibovis]|uniref:2-C-methyl-D-erythritol 4-phosphate cytidylyltransferase n=1 Tax=Moraxella nasibovis TaxID=2904120 RepID=UPI00240F1E89|nr:2-C-methyl-D-erythritol 4-phosphate cytidylyltransferase [Moraxella nasibovis]WFF39089.1 2-C-methyl-D-erythritol 4-phosphate cytidylyltransferase [Moraxella nasibovis]
MKDAHQVHGLIVAAGKGLRLGADRPKQYLQITDKTVLEESVARLNVDALSDLTLVVAKDDAYAAKLSFDFAGEVHRTFGGDERWQSVKNGVKSIRDRGAKDTDWVLIHDAARPCLPRADLMAVLTALKQTTHDGVILAAPVVDTLKQVDGSSVVKTVSREGLWQAQTPQIFRLGALEKVLAEVAAQGLVITDEASGFEMLGLSVEVVAGSRLNMKLTYAEDLPLLRFILSDLIE